MPTYSLHTLSCGMLSMCIALAVYLFLVEEGRHVTTISSEKAAQAPTESLIYCYAVSGEFRVPNDKVKWSKYCLY